MRQGVRFFSNSLRFSSALLLVFSLGSPFQVQAQAPTPDLQQLFLECLNKTIQSSLQSSLQSWGLHSTIEPKNNPFKDGLPLVGKDGLSLHWKDENPLPFIHKYTESDSEHLSQGFTAKIYDRNKQPFHEITVIMPVYVREDGKTVNEAYAQQVFGTVVQSISQLPLLHIDALEKIEVNPSPNKWDEFWKNKYNMSEPSSGSSGEKSIQVFPTGVQSLLSGDDHDMVRHEFGHLLAEKFFHSTMPPDEYTQLAHRDAHFPSNYAKASPMEDFAEAVRVYIQSDAGRSNPELRKQLENRFAYLDKLVTNDPNAKKFALYSLATAAVSAGMFSQNAQAHQMKDGTVWINDGHGRLILLQDSVPPTLSAKNTPSKKETQN